MNETEAVEAEIIAPKSPLTWNSTHRIGGRLAMAGVGNKDARIMFIATCPQEEETQEVHQLHYGKSFKIPAVLLKGPGGALLVELSIRNGMDLKQDAYYTTLVKTLPEKAKRSSPHKEDIEFWREALLAEIAEVKPAIIVCLGKPVFDALYPLKFKAAELKGGFFPCKDHDCLLYPCSDVYQLVKRPELYGRFFLDFQEVIRMDRMLGGDAKWQPYPRDYRTISNKAELEALMGEIEASGATLMSVDCEWAGRNHIDGKLRSLQVAWAPGKAAYIRFMDAEMSYAFDCSYAQAGLIMGRLWNRPRYKYVGHHLAADFPWMYHVLGLSVYEKGYVDTEFALQCCDEFADLGLERLAIAYTDLGKYDVELQIWKKTHKMLEDDGYGRIPDEIIIPYGCRDVDTVIRAVPHIVQFMERERVSEYYFNILHPFVTDVFTEFAMLGLPMDVDRMDELRFIFHTTRRLMEGQIQKDICAESRQIMWERLYAQDPLQAEDTFLLIENLCRDSHDTAEAFNVIKKFAGIEELDKWSALFEHYVVAPDFNIRSTTMMRRWLFDVKGYEPVKSTKNDAQGLPSTSWDRVLQLPEGKQALFKPAVDRQTLEILQATHEDELLTRLLELNSVGNLCKAFLKESTKDVDGEVIKENGLHFWLASDQRIHGQMSTTETGRPRSWKPNCLNWPSYTQEAISLGIKKTLQRALDEGMIEADSREAAYLGDKPIPAVRSCVCAPAGMMMVESDYATAEIRALAFISGDEALIKLMTEPDKCFGLVHPAGDSDPTPVRLNYVDGQGIDQVAWKQEYILSDVANGKILRQFTEADLLRDDAGAIIHPPADLHWALAEFVRHVPREDQNKKTDRVAAKRGNFGASYGIMAGTLERQVEQETGVKPEEGTGEKILQALEDSRPVAFAFLRALEDTPINPGWLRAASGRKRRFALHSQDIGGISSRARKGALSAQGREARNYFCQESVAATAARAAVWLLREYKKLGLSARPMIVLYDSVVTLCVPHERDIVTALHQKYMTDQNCWSYHGRIMNFPIDTDLNLRWSTKPTADEAKAWVA